jgi:UDP-N-acetylmuramoyl-tripeptide--D-alanyl-D-alanine ligase
LPPSSAALRLAMPGRHSVMAALPAVAVALAEGLTWTEIAVGLEGVTAHLRLVPRAGINGITLLDDAYNASPASVLAALDLLAELPGRHVAVLGDMLELGDYEEEGHGEVGRGCARMADALVAVGGRARGMAASARAAGMAEDSVYHAQDTDAAIPLLRSILRQGDVVLIKGSRGMAMERIVRDLEAT